MTAFSGALFVCACVFVVAVPVGFWSLLALVLRSEARVRALEAWRKQAESAEPDHPRLGHVGGLDVVARPPPMPRPDVWVSPYREHGDPEARATRDLLAEMSARLDDHVAALAELRRDVRRLQEERLPSLGFEAPESARARTLVAAVPPPPPGGVYPTPEEKATGT